MLVNPLRPSHTIWRHESGSPSLQVMACCLLGAQPLYDLILTYGQAWEQMLEKLEWNYNNFYSKCSLLMSSDKDRPFCPNLDVLTRLFKRCWDQKHRFHAKDFHLFKTTLNKYCKLIYLLCTLLLFENICDITSMCLYLIFTVSIWRIPQRISLIDLRFQS